jgi:trehalose/maltose hydrolase-like predicted phosphorylase
MKGSKKNAILHNRFVLYFIFIIALGNLLTLVYSRDYYSASIFVLIGFLTSFFSKNMIVILCIAIAFTNIIKYGAKAGVEGMTQNESDEGEESETKGEGEESETKGEGEESETKGEGEESETKIKTKTKTKEKKSKSTDDAISLSVETNESSNKEKFDQSKDVVYTSEEEKEIAKTEKMILSQEKMLKSMNKYKPLLDTLQGITKNMALVKGAASTSDE